MSFLGGLVSGAAKLAGGIIKSTPIGQALTTLGGIVHSDSKVATIIKTPIAPLPAPAAISAGNPNEYIHVQDGSSDGRWVMRKDAAQYMTPARPALPTLAMGGGGPFGDVTGGSSSTAPARRGGVPDLTGYRYYKRRRRINPMNVRAARRAVSRIHAAEKLFKKIFSISHGHAAGHVTPKRRKR